MPELPTWLITAITSAIGAVITFFVTRRLYQANVAEKEANAASTLAQVCASLAKQVREFSAEIPAWRQKIAVETARADAAERENVNEEFIKEQAKIIVEACAELSYMKDPEEPESKVERLFKTVKEAARKIAEVE